MKNKTIIAYKSNSTAVKLRGLNASPKVETSRERQRRDIIKLDSLLVAHKQTEKKPISVSNM